MGAVKVKYRGRWMTTDEMQALREAEPMVPLGSVPPNPVDPEDLPPPGDLPAEDRLAHLGDRVPAVRRYLTAGGQIRSGLSPEDRSTAERIVEKYR